MDRNPFEILGISKEFVKRLSDEQICVLVETNHRTLQTFFHPDKTGGSEEKSRELNWAKEQLEDENSFKLYKQEYLRKSKPVRLQIGELESKIKHYRFIEARYYSLIVEYLSRLANFPGELTVFDAPQFILEINDTFLASREGTYLRELSYKNENVFTSHFYLEISDDNVITKKYVQIVREGGEKKEKLRKTLNFKNKMLIGVYPISTGKGVNGETAILKLILRGQMVEAQNQQIPILSGKVSKPADYMKNARISLAGFKTLMPYLTLDLRQNGYLFSINKDGDKIFFELEGKISRIREK